MCPAPALEHLAVQYRPLPPIGVSRGELRETVELIRETLSRRAALGHGLRDMDCDCELAWAPGTPNTKPEDVKCYLQEHLDGVAANVVVHTGRRSREG